MFFWLMDTFHPSDSGRNPPKNAGMTDRNRGWDDGNFQKMLWLRQGVLNKIFGVWKEKMGLLPTLPPENSWQLVKNSCIPDPSSCYLSNILACSTWWEKGERVNLPNPRGVTVVIRFLAVAMCEGETHTLKGRDFTKGSKKAAFAEVRGTFLGVLKHHPQGLFSWWWKIHLGHLWCLNWVNS